MMSAALNAWLQLGKRKIRFHVAAPIFLDLNHVYILKTRRANNFTNSTEIRKIPVKFTWLTLWVVDL